MHVCECHRRIPPLGRPQSRRRRNPRRGDCTTAQQIRQLHRRYLNRIHGLKHELPVQYDLTLNTDSLTTATAAALIAAAARA